MPCTVRSVTLKSFKKREKPLCEHSLCEHSLLCCQNEQYYIITSGALYSRVTQSHCSRVRPPCEHSLLCCIITLPQVPYTVESVTQSHCSRVRHLCEHSLLCCQNEQYYNITSGALYSGVTQSHCSRVRPPCEHSLLCCIITLPQVPFTVESVTQSHCSRVRHLCEHSLLCCQNEQYYNITSGALYSGVCNSKSM